MSSVQTTTTNQTFDLSQIEEYADQQKQNGPLTVYKRNGNILATSVNDQVQVVTPFLREIHEAREGF